MRLNESSKHSFYNSLMESLEPEGKYYYKRFSGAGEIDYLEFEDEWEAHNYAEKVNKETGDETAVYDMETNECLELFDAIEGKDLEESYDEEYVIDDEKLKQYAEKYQKSSKVADEMFSYNTDPYNQPQEVIDRINKGIVGCENYQQLLDDYENNPDSDWYIDVIKAAQRELAWKKIKDKEKEEQDAAANEEKEYRSAKRELDKLRKEHSTRIGRIDYLFNLIKDYESKHGIEESSLTEDYKPVQDMWEGPGTYYIAAKPVTGTSLESSYDISDKEQFKKFLSDHPEYVENNCKGYRANLHTHGTSSYRGKYWKNDLTEDDEVKYKIPDYAKECIEEGIYDSRGIDVRSALFQGNTLVVESREELTNEVFDKIAKIIESYFRSYGVVADSIEDDGNKVLAIDCFMTEEGYQEYLANADSDDEKLVVNGQEFNDVYDAKAWLDEKLSEYGNTYFFPNEEKYVLEKLIEKFGNTYFWK